MGIVDLRYDGEDFVHREIIRFVRHPNYNHNTLDYDYSVLTFNGAATGIMDSVSTTV